MVPALEHVVSIGGQPGVARDPHQGALPDRAVSPDGRLFATAGDSRTIKRWNASNLTCASTYCHGNFPGGKVATMTWNRPGTTCTTCHGCGVNDDWQSSPDAAQISAKGLAPSNPRESAIYATLPPGAYGAILSGVNGATGTGLVEVYAVQ